MILRKYEIVLVNFPFTDLSRIKLRPALAVRPLPGENAILCQITTKRRDINSYEIRVERRDCDGQIRFDSYAYLDMLFTLHRSLIKRKLGRVMNATKCRQIDKKLTVLFDSEQNQRSAA